MTSLIDLFENPEYLKARDAFKSGLLEIETKHIEWFKNRKPKREDEEHDKLHNHYYINKKIASIDFGFYNDSELPNDIKDECLDAFKKHFSQGQD